MRADVAALAARARAHEFDLLGSGVVKVAHGAACLGVEGHRYYGSAPIRPDSEGNWLSGRITESNLPIARDTWRLIESPYVPIDWQLDFKSGFRWSESTWYRDVQFGHLSGVDVKVPRELARMQHLPALAWAYAFANDGERGFEPSEAYVREFRNQIIDFAATNPPSFGVNWFCTMDVAIRAANWLVAHDLFCALGARFDEDFHRVFFNAVCDHGRHIVGNLEWYPDVRGNHYLSDVVGLLFVAAYLPSTEETDAWLAFALRELVAEVDYQFGADGGNFEASTSYHRLSAELVAYGTALALGLEPARLRAAAAADLGRLPRLDAARGGEAVRPSVPVRDGTLDLPSSYFERLERMAEFTVDVTRPDGRIAQIGDNDSGRFLKLRAVHAEDPLDHRHIVAALNGIVHRVDLAATAAPFALESEMVRSLSGRGGAESERPARPHASSGVRVGTASEWDRWRSADRSAARRLEHRFGDAGGSLREGLEIRGYPDFGVWVFRAPRLFLAFRCGSIGQNGNGGHAHNDQLSVELVIDGRDVVRDPGTYLYTPLPRRRNEYRSVSAHFAPRVEGREPGSLDFGLFRLGNEAQAMILYFGPEGCAGRHHGFGEDVFRRVEILDDAVVITDWSSLELADTYRPPPFSRGYGLRE